MTASTPHRGLAPLAAGLFAALTGCSAPPPPLTDALLWIEALAPDSAAEICTVEVDHNFAGAVPRGQAGSAQLVEVDQLTESAEGVYAYLTRHGSERLVLNLAGEVLTGDFVDERSVDVAWTASEVRESSIDWFEEYRFAGGGTELVEETLALRAIGEDTGEFEGTWTVRRIQELGYVESDEWDSSGTDIFFSSTPASTWLETIDGLGSVANRAVSDDCLEEECRLLVSADCTRRLDLAASIVEGGIEAFDALEAYRRPEGLPTP